MHKGILSLAFSLIVLPTGLAWAGSGTEASIRNESPAPVSVTLREADGTTIEFTALAPNTTSVPQKITAGGETRITISSGQAKEGTVNLRRGDENVIAVSDTHEPRLDAPRKRALDSGSHW